jgi:hypothetical protein
VVDFEVALEIHCQLYRLLALINTTVPVIVHRIITLGIRRGGKRERGLYAVACMPLFGGCPIQEPAGGVWCSSGAQGLALFE